MSGRECVIRPPRDGLTYSLPLMSAIRLDPIYVARIPAAPFAMASLLVKETRGVSSKTLPSCRRFF